MIIAPEKPFYGNELIVTCNFPREYYDTESKMQLDWVGPNGSLLTENNSDIVVRDMHTAGNYIERDFVFTFPTPKFNGLYTCQLRIHSKPVVSREYELEVLSKYTSLNEGMHNLIITHHFRQINNKFNTKWCFPIQFWILRDHSLLLEWE